MSSKFHNKFHRHNHHTTPVPDPRYPDAAHDPIASQLAPFLGTFWLSSGDIQIVNGEIYTQSGNSVQWSLATSDSVTTVLGIINSLFLPLTGGTVDGSLNVTGLTRAYGGMQISNNLTVFGDISATGNSYFANTVYTTTSALSVVNLASNGPAFYVGNNGSGDLASFYDLDTGTEVFHIGGQNGSYPNIGVKTSTPNEALTVNGSISARNDIKTSGVIYTDGGNSTLWNAARTNVWENSATWNIGANASTNVRDNSGNWIFNNGNTFAGDMTIGTNDNYKVVLETNNSPRVTVDTSGNVGIGTTPGYKLDVEGSVIRLASNATSGYGYIQFGKSSTITNNWHIGSEGNNNFVLYNGNFGSGSPKLLVDSGGNVGIGVTSPATNSRLDISGGGLNIGGTGALDASLHIKSSFGGADRMTQIQPNAASKPALNLMASTDSSSNLQWWSWGVNSNIWSIQPGTNFTGSNGLFINGSGNVGIGADPAPNYKLDVNGDANVRTGYKLLSAGQDVITIVQNAAAAAGGVGGNGTGGYVTKWSGTGTVANSVAYDDGSNIGIGTTIPGTKLDVAGNARITASGQTLALAGTDHAYIGWYPAGYANGRKSYLGFGGVNDNRFYIDNEVTDGTGHIILDPGTNANVGIGETVPGVKLDVKGTCAVDYLRVDATDTVNEGGEIQLVGAGSNGSVQIDNHAGDVRIHTLGTNNSFTILGGAGSTAFRVEHGTAFIGNLPTGSTNSVVTESSNILQRRTINPSVWDTTNKLSLYKSQQYTGADIQNNIEVTNIPSNVQMIEVVIVKHSFLNVGGAGWAAIQLGTSSGYITSGYVSDGVITTATGSFPLWNMTNTAFNISGVHRFYTRWNNAALQKVIYEATMINMNSGGTSGTSNFASGVLFDPFSNDEPISKLRIGYGLGGTSYGGSIPDTAKVVVNYYL